MRKFTAVVAGCIVAASSSMAGTAISYFSSYHGTPTGGVYANAAFTTVVPGDKLLSTVGCFIQLIKDDGGNGIGAADASKANGLADTADMVIDKTWMGGGTTANPSGWFQKLNFKYVHAQGDVFYVRIWNKPATDFASGTIPLADAVVGTYYHDYRFVAASLDITSMNVNQPTGQAAAGKTYTDTLLPVPEPATMALFGLGIVALAVRRIRK